MVNNKQRNKEWQNDNNLYRKKKFGFFSFFFRVFFQERESAEKENIRITHRKLDWVRAIFPGERHLVFFWPRNPRFGPGIFCRRRSRRIWGGQSKCRKRRLPDASPAIPSTRCPQPTKHRAKTTSPLSPDDPAETDSPAPVECPGR